MLMRMGRWNLLLDLVFVVWAVHFMATGQVLPSAIEALLSTEQPISVSVEPEQLPGLPAEVVELVHDNANAA